MKQWVLVFLGGGLGSVLRYFLSKALNPYLQNFYLGTFLVNILGCLLIGLVIGLSLKDNYITQNQSLFLATGFCGGFTTFSAFALEDYSLLKTGDLFYFSVYTLSSIVLGILGVAAGLWLAKSI